MKKTKSKKEVVAKKVKSAKKNNVLAFKKPETQQEKSPAPQPKAHPFAAFMKGRFNDRNFSSHGSKKMGSQDFYRKKAV
jgi:hypothetical protein